MGKSDEHLNSKGNLVEEYADNSKDDALSDQYLTLAFHDKSSMRTSSGRLSCTREEASTNSAESQELSNMRNLVELVANGEVESPEIKRKNIITGEHEGKGSSMPAENTLFGFGPKIPEISPRKVKFHYYCQFSSCLIIGQVKIVIIIMCMFT